MVRRQRQRRRRGPRRPVRRQHGGALLTTVARPLLGKLARAGLRLGKAGALAGAKWGIKKLAKRFRKSKRRPRS